LEELDRYEEAAEKYQQAHQLRPDDSTILVLWSTALAALDRYDEVIEKYQRTNAWVRGRVGFIEQECLVTMITPPNR